MQNASFWIIATTAVSLAAGANAAAHLDMPDSADSFPNERPQMALRTTTMPDDYTDTTDRTAALGANPSGVGADCPPGIDQPACVPPGMAMEREIYPETNIHGTDEISGYYVRVKDPAAYNLDPAYEYVRRDNEIFLLDAFSGRMLERVALLRE